MKQLMLPHQTDILQTTLILVTDTSPGDVFEGNVAGWKFCPAFMNEIILWSHSRGYVVEFFPNKWRNGESIT